MHTTVLMNLQNIMLKKPIIKVYIVWFYLYKMPCTGRSLEEK